MSKPLTFQEIIIALEGFWANRGCLIWQPHNVQVGAGTMNPATFLQVLGPEPWNVGYVEPSIRPADSRYGQNPNRLQRFYQYQVILKPEPGNPQEIYLQSLDALGIDRSRHDVRFVEDNWESPALGAWGLGWEVWLDGQEITQYTYFQQSGGFTTDPVSVEITYGLERIAMPLQGVRHFRDIEWAPGVSYAEVNLQAEVEYSKYNLDYADVDALKDLFDVYERQAQRLLEAGLVLPAYDFVLNCSQTFNVLDARGAVGVTERAHFFNRMRALSRNVARAFIQQREELGYPRLKPWLVGGALAPREPEAQGAPEPQGPRPLLLEIGTEELPSGDVWAAMRQLRENAEHLLDEARLTHGEIEVTGTPRRLVLMAEAVADRQADEVEELKGPPARVAFDAEGRPTKAAQGFARSAGVAPEELQVRKEGAKEYVVARVRREGRPSGVILSELLPKLVASLTFERSMRWDGRGATFSRPIRWLVALLGPNVIPFEYAGLYSGRISRGLRPFNSPPIEITDAARYQRMMMENHVVVGTDARRSSIVEQARRLAEEVGGQIPPDPALLDEVTNLIEEPNAIRGRFDEEFLALPADVLIAAMKKHQRYFHVTDARSQRILPYFIMVANGQDLDQDLVRTGNEEVLRARFADATFFFQSDASRKLEEFLPRLETLVFQERLGSMRDKAQRLEGLAAFLAERLQLSAQEKQVTQRAAHLSKADLATQMVIEMTSLQGIMGREYALLQGESSAVAEAIAEHYLPRGAGDILPRSRPGMALALADRIDTLMGLFAIGMLPSGSADPFGLRRAALGIVQILTEYRISLPLREPLSQACRLLPVTCDEAALGSVLDFVAGRLRVWLLDQGLRYDVVDAALAERGDDPFKAYEAARDLARWVEREDWPEILAAYSRCVRIVRGQDAIYGVEPQRFVEPATVALYDAYLRAREAVSPQGSVDDLFAAFMPMIEPINRFFDDVLVMAEDQALRENRLGLLQRIAGLTRGIVDLSKVEGF